MVEEIRFNDKILAFIIRANFKTEGIKFFTPNNFSQQLGYMNHEKGHIIKPHVHNLVKREVSYTKEVLFIKSGRVRVDFYTEEKSYVKSLILCPGDFILLAFGGHGFKILEDSEIIEVKQGPYSGEADKSRFEEISEELIHID